MKTRGLVVKAYSNFFNVVLLEPAGQSIPAGSVLEAQLRGRFRQQETTVLTGDRVVLTASPEGTTTTAVIEDIEPRTSQLHRPPVANVDQVILVFTLTQPDFNWSLVDRQLVLSEAEQLPVVMCLNKADLVDGEQLEAITSIYRQIGYPVVVTSATTGAGLTRLEQILSYRISVLAGQSGVGKSSLLNAINPEFELKMTQVSNRGGRGRHTTRHVELLPLGADGWVADTPGFNYLELNQIGSAALRHYFPELERLRHDCRFADCLHDREPGCAVQEAVKEGHVHPRRYKHYLDLLNELRQREVNQYR